MLLNHDRIKNLGLVQSAKPIQYGATTCDLTVGRIITDDGEVASPFSLEPEAIVRVVSTERIKLPANISGYALIKNRLCDRGILPLNIGVIDPGYDGLVSATLLNFGNRAFKVATSEIFLRLTFHEFTAATYSVPAPMTDQQYVEDKILITRAHFSKTFLNAEALVARLGVSRRDIIKWASIAIAIAGIVLALVPFLVTLGVDYAARKWTPTPSVAEIAQRVATQRDDVDRHIAELQKQVDDLRQQVNALQTKALATSAQPKTVKP